MAKPSVANYLVVPRATCESWNYLPVRFTDKIHAGNYWTIVGEAKLFQFGVLNSSMHMAWIKCISGRLNCYDRSNYTPTIRNFPWPITHTQSQIRDIEEKAMAVLELRQQYPAMALPDLYDPVHMPSALYDAHADLDTVVDEAYGQPHFDSDYSRIGFLFNLDRQISSLLVTKAGEITISGYQPVPEAKRLQAASFNSQF